MRDETLSTESFKMNETEAIRIRRGAFLPAFLILPMAAMFGFDESKSQPMHFLMIFAMASGLAAVVVSISWYGAKRRIDEFSRMTLQLATDRLVWTTSLGETIIPFVDVTSLSITRVRGVVRAITIGWQGGKQATIEGFQDMERIADRLALIEQADIDVTKKWISI